MDCWQIALEYLKVFVDLLKGIAWPAGVLGAALLFRKEIASIIPNLEEAGMGGVKLRAPAQQAAKPESSGLSNEVLGPAVKLEAEGIIKSLEEIEPKDREARLISALAYSRLGRYFDSTYGQIFGSQIAGLRRLAGLNSVSISDAEEFYKTEAVGKNPEAYKNSSFHNWLSFLRGRKLIVEKDEKIEITELGREFLNYLALQNLSDTRPF